MSKSDAEKRQASRNGCRALSRRLVFGLIGLMGSFVPCLGALALYVAVPAALASGSAVAVAYQQHAKRSFAIAALTVSLIGVVISSAQLLSLNAAARAATEQLQQHKNSP